MKMKSIRLGYGRKDRKIRLLPCSGRSFAATSCFAPTLLKSGLIKPNPTKSNLIQPVLHPGREVIPKCPLLFTLRKKLRRLKGQNVVFPIKTEVFGVWHGCCNPVLPKNFIA